MAITNKAMVAEGLIAEADAYVFGAAPAPQKPKPKGFVIPDQPPTPAATGPALRGRWGMRGAPDGSGTGSRGA